MVSMSIFAILLFTAFMVVKFTKGLGKLALGVALGLSMAGTVFGPPAVAGMESMGNAIAQIGHSAEGGDTTVAPDGPNVTLKGGGHR